MIALDTSVVVRLIIQDDPAQLAMARSVVSQPCFVSLSVLMEAGWVLQGSYGLGRRELARALLNFCELETLFLARADQIRWALRRLESVKADLADLLHLTDCAPADQFVTFDRKLRRQAGEGTPVPIAVIGG